MLNCKLYIEVIGRLSLLLFITQAGGTEPLVKPIPMISATNGAAYPFAASINTAQTLDISVAMTVDPVDVGKEAAIYIVVYTGNQWFMLDSNGAWLVWNYPDLSSLMANKSNQTLAGQNTLGIAKQLNGFKGAGDIYVGYKVDGGDFRFTTEPVTFSSFTQKIDDTGVKKCANYTQVGLDCPVPDFPGQDAQYAFTANQPKYTRIYDNNTALAVNADDVGKKADIYVVVYSSSNWFMLDKDGNRLSWDLNTNSLVPYVTKDSLLAQENFSIATNADDVYYVGYKVEGGALVYTLKTWCVIDNISGLWWEVKKDSTVSGLQNQDNLYTWYNPDMSNNGGSVGVINGGSCAGSLCDTLAYTQAINAINLCGKNDWRLPTREELFSLVDNSRFAPAIDINYFPNTPAFDYWSSSPRAIGSNDAWSIYFYYGSVTYGTNKNSKFRVRLVRDGR